MSVPDTSVNSLLDLYQNAPCGFHSLDADGTFIRINDTELGWLGYRREEMLGRMKLTDILTADSRRTFEDHFPLFKTQGIIRDVEVELIRKDGTLLPVLVSATAVRDPKGSLLMSRSILYDLSERKHIDALRKKSEARYRLIFENSMDGVLLTAPDGRIFDANPSACSIFGRTREEIVAAGRDKLMDTSDPALARILEERKDRGMAHGELTALHPDGTSFPVEVSSAIFRDEDGGEFTCLILRDITRRKQSQAERERLITELQEALGKVDLLSGLLSICSSCKKIRDEEGRWQQLEIYIRDRSAADFTHGMCPDCMKKLYPDYGPK